MRRKAMPKFPREQMNTEPTASKKTVPMSKADFIEVNGEKLYPQYLEHYVSVQKENEQEKMKRQTEKVEELAPHTKKWEVEEAKAKILVFSATKPAPDQKVDVPHLILHANKLHWWCAGDKLFLSEERPAHSVVVDELRKTVAKQVISSFRSAPNANELKMIDTLVPMVLEAVGSRVEKISPELLETIVKDLVKNYKSHPDKGFSAKSIQAAQQVISFDSTWKAIKSSCGTLQANDYIELMKRNVSVEFLQGFQALLGGAHISRTLLFSFDFNEAMRFHAGDPENSKMLLDALKRDKAYDPVKICQAYCETMQAIEGSHQFFPNNSEAEKKATALRIEKFISQASAKIQHSEINTQLLYGIGAMIYPETAFIVSPRKTDVTEFAKEFKGNFPGLDVALRDLIERENVKNFTDLEVGDKARFVDQSLQKMVGDLASKLEKYAKAHDQSFNAFREFSALEGSRIGNRLPELIAQYKVTIPHHKAGQKVAPHKTANARSISNAWGLLGKKSAWGKMDEVEMNKAEVEKRVATSKAKAEAAPKPKGTKDYVEINGEKLYPQMQDHNLVFATTKPKDPLEIDLSKVNVNLAKSHWWWAGEGLFFSEQTPVEAVIVDKLRENIAKQVASSLFHSKPNANDQRMIDKLVPMVLRELGSDVQKLTPELLQTVTKNLVKDWNSRNRTSFGEETIGAAKQVMKFDSVWKAIKSSCEIYPNDYVDLNKRYNRLVGEFEIKNKMPMQVNSVEVFIKGFRDTVGGTIARKLLFSNEFNEAMKLHINDPENSKKLLENLTRGKAYDPAKLCSAYVGCMRLIQEYRQMRPIGSDLENTNAKIGAFIMTAGNALQHNTFDNALLNQLKEQIIPDTSFLASPKKVNAKDFTEAFRKNFPELHKTFNAVIQDNPLVVNIEKRNHKKVGSNPDERLKNMVVDIASKLQKAAPKSKTAFNAYSDFVTLESEEKAHAQKRAGAIAEQPAVVIHVAQGQEAAAPAKDVNVGTHSPAVSNLLRAQGYLDKKVGIDRADLNPDTKTKEEPKEKQGLLRRAAQKMHLTGSGKPHMSADRKAPKQAKFVDPNAGKGEGVQR